MWFTNVGKSNKYFQMQLEWLNECTDIFKKFFTGINKDENTSISHSFQGFNSRIVLIFVATVVSVDTIIQVPS